MVPTGKRHAIDEQRQRGGVDSASRGQGSPGKERESSWSRAGGRRGPLQAGRGASLQRPELSRNTGKSGDEAGREGPLDEGNTACDKALRLFWIPEKGSLLVGRGGERGGRG